MKVRNAPGRQRHRQARAVPPTRQVFGGVILEESERLAIPQPQVRFVRPVQLAHEDVFAKSGYLSATDGIVGAIASVQPKSGRTSIMSAFGSCVMVAPGLAMTATHVFQEALRHRRVVVATPRIDGSTVLWDIVGQHAFETVNDAPAIIGANNSQLVDVCLVAVAPLSMIPNLPLHLPHFEVARPQVGERLWAVGFREYESGLHDVVSSGIVTQQAFGGRGHVPSACVQVEMTAPGGMSGCPVFNSLGHVVGVVSKGIGDHEGTCTVSLIWPTFIPSMKPLWPGDLYRTPLTLPELSILGRARLHGAARWDDGSIVAEIADLRSLVEETDLPVPLKVVCPLPLLVGLITQHRRVLACVIRGLVLTNLTRRPLTVTRLSLALSVGGQRHTARIASVHVREFEGDPNCVFIQRNENRSAVSHILGGWQPTPLLPKVLEPMKPVGFDGVYAFDNILYPDRTFDCLIGPPTILPVLRHATLTVEVEGGASPLTFQISLGAGWREQFEFDPTMAEAI